MYFGDEKIVDAVPNDTCNQVHPHFQLKKILQTTQRPIKLLDLGCGAGNSFAAFKKYSDLIEWYGLDVESSPEVDSRVHQSANILTYDGIHIPFDDNFFDIIYSNQVLEHVLFPFELIKEVNRVLKKGGHFVGSVSYLELYHSYSVYNYTPYGLKMFLENNGIKLIELRPGPDILTMLLQKILGKIPFFSKLLLYQYDHESVPNVLVTLFLKLLRKSNTQVNLVKLLFSGHIRFLSQKV